MPHSCLSSVDRSRCFLPSRGRARLRLSIDRTPNLPSSHPILQTHQAASYALLRGISLAIICFHFHRRHTYRARFNSEHPALLCRHKNDIYSFPAIASSDFRNASEIRNSDQPNSFRRCFREQKAGAGSIKSSCVANISVLSIMPIKSVSVVILIAVDLTGVRMRE